LVLFKIKTNFF